MYSGNKYASTQPLYVFDVCIICVCDEEDTVDKADGKDEEDGEDGDTTSFKDGETIDSDLLSIVIVNELFVIENFFVLVIFLTKYKNATINNIKKTCNIILFIIVDSCLNHKFCVGVDVVGVVVVVVGVVVGIVVGVVVGVIIGVVVGVVD